MMIDQRIIKVRITSKGGYPFNMLESTPSLDCVFDSFHGTVWIDVYPFAVTTRVSACNQIFLKVYEDETD